MHDTVVRVNESPVLAGIAVTESCGTVATGPAPALTAVGMPGLTDATVTAPQISVFGG